jgi:hypothetical protein
MNGLTEQEYAELKKQGYSDEMIARAMQEQQGQEQSEWDSAYENAQRQRGQMGEQSTFQYNPSDNLYKWQLELNDILERAEHILKEDVVAIEGGNVIWKPNPTPEKRIFNDYGVQEIMRILSMYINRNTILSDYEPKEINDKVFDFGKEVNDLIFMKYEGFGLDTLEKRKNYPMLVREIVDIVHSAYKRALYGGERDSLRTARSIAQQEQIMPMGMEMMSGMQPKKERGILNPFRYMAGKYK